jgi:2-isopropylmalate synthase
MVALYTGIMVQPNKAIVGANAFAHESGIHQHGVLAHANTYEIMTPESVGLTGEEGGRGTLVLGKHSGKAAYRQRLIELGYADIAADSEQLSKIVEGAKALADKKKTLSDYDLEALIGDKLYSSVETWELRDLVVSASSKEAGKITTSTATVTMRNNVDESEVMEAAIGIGPVDATFKAILKLIDRPLTLTQYQVTKIEGGSGPDAPGNDALASVVTQIKAAKAQEQASVELPADFPGHHGATVRPVVSPEGNELGVVKTASTGGIAYTGIGHSTDIIVASARAYISAINRMVEHEAKR